MSDTLMTIDIRQINNGTSESTTRRAESSSDKVSSDSSSLSANSSAQQDSIQLSDKSQLVSSLLTDLASMPEVNESRVEQLRASIASGEFSVSADKIASKMLALDIGLRKLG